MKYTIDDVNKFIADNGLFFSNTDMKLAQENPDAGMSIASYKLDYKNAKTDDQRALAHAGSEKIRSDYGGYTGGGDGSQFYLNEPSPQSFSSEEFKNPYADQTQSTLDKIMNREEFSYDPNTDPLFQSYRQMNLREADRAQQNALGQAAAMTGGMPSTAAISAASQAGDYYRSQIGDNMTQFADAAKQNYIDSLGLDFDTLSALTNLSQQKRDEYDTDRNFAYNQWTDDLSFKADKENVSYEQEQYAREYADSTNDELARLYLSLYDSTQNAEYLNMALARIKEIGK